MTRFNFLLMIFSMLEKIPIHVFDIPPDDFFDARKNTYPMYNKIFIFYTKCLRRTVGPNLMTHLTLMIFSILEKIPIRCSLLVYFPYLLLEIFFVNL